MPASRLWLLSNFGQQYLTIFSEFAFPHSLQLSSKFSTANSFCKFWCSKLQLLGAHSFCIWDNLIQQIGIAVFLMIFASALSPFHPVDQNFCRKKSLFLEKSPAFFSLELSVGRFPKHRNYKSNTNTDNECFQRSSFSSQCECFD